MFEDSNSRFAYVTSTAAQNISIKNSHIIFFGTLNLTNAIMNLIYFVALSIFDLVFAQPPGTISPLAEYCGPSTSIVCINKYASVMPYHFFREPSSNGSYEDTYASTAVPSDLSWTLVEKADFLVFDQKLGLDLLGPSPSYEFMFAVNDGAYLAIYSLRNSGLFGTIGC
jgi:hypothetical protein